jgi:hypothetical protein
MIYLRNITKPFAPGGLMKNIFTKKSVENVVEGVAYALQMVIAALIAIGLVIGIIDLTRYFANLYSVSTSQSYDLFQNFLAYALLLIIGVELILLVLYRSTRQVLELILFVIARKMLIYSHTMLDLVLGTLALAFVFAIQRYLVLKEEDLLKGRFEKSPLSGLQELISGKDEDGTNLALGKQDAEIKVGSTFVRGDSEITVTKLSDDGDIEEAIVCSRVDYKSQAEGKS